MPTCQVDENEIQQRKRIFIKNVYNCRKTKCHIKAIKIIYQLVMVLKTRFYNEFTI